MNPEKQQPGTEGTAPRGADMYDALAWLEVNKTKLGVIALIVVLIGFAVATMRYFGQQKELNASTALLALRPALTPSTNVPVAEPSAYLEVAQEFSGTAAAERARFLAASRIFEEGKYAEAETAFREFLQQHSSSPWAAGAAFGQATSLEALGKTDEALSAYQQIATAYSNSAVVDDARLAIARIYETRGEAEQALRVYNELTAGDTMPTPAVMQRKEALLMAHPELDTNQPAAFSPAPVQIAPSTSSVPAAADEGSPSNVTPVEEGSAEE